MEKMMHQQDRGTAGGGGGARGPDPPNFLTTEKTEEFTVLKTYIQYRLHK